MRTRIALAVTAVGLAASFLPMSPANAVCINAYQQLTGRCSPCNDVGAVFRTLHDKYGVPEASTNCLA